MISIKDKSKCCGCAACRNICPQKCIHMVMKQDGFLYPEVEEEKCSSCGLCEMVCPMKKRVEGFEVPDVYCAYNKDDAVLKNSSSGGIFWGIAKCFIENGGVVFGVKIGKDFQVYHHYAENIEDCKAFRGSKYLQSDIGVSYLNIQKFLQEERIVLFSGTPCQVAGLKAFLGKEYDNLVTVDVVCHGVPSRSVFDKYLVFLEKKMNKKPISVNWRDKEFGWGPNHISYYYEDGSKTTTTSQENALQKGFLQNLYLRPSCYSCPFAKIPRVGDISLADFWGYKGKLLDQNNNKGLSMVVVSSEKGRTVFDGIKDGFVFEEVDLDYAKTLSRHLWIHPYYNPESRIIWKNIEKYSFDKIEKRFINKNIMTRCISKAYKILRRVKV